MTHVVTENCILCKYGSCLEVCPVVCFHEGENFIVINPDECVDCGMCVEACEAGAIYSDIHLPEKYQRYVDLNKQYSVIWPMVTEINMALDNSDFWNSQDNKIQYLL